MTILAYTMAGPTSLDDKVNYYNFNTIPAIDASASNDTYAPTYTESFYFKKFLENTELNSVDPYRPVIDVLPVAYDELWVRHCYKQRDFLVSTTNPFILLTLYTLSAGVYYKSMELRLGRSAGPFNTFFLATYNASGTQIAENTIGAITSAFHNTTNKEIILDFRIKLDPVAGYVQLYSYTNTLMYEFLGKTIEAAITPTHFALNCCEMYNSNGYTYQGFPLFSILATEKTFGMYVVPLTVKAEGTEQQQDAGSTYAALAGRKRLPTTTGNVSMTVQSGQSKTYTCKLKDATDVGLPANYLVKSLKLSGIFEATQTEPTAVDVDLVTKIGSTVYTHNVDTIVPNTNAASDNKWQVRHAQLDLNPATGLPWEVADLANLEVGFKLTGA